MTPLPLPALVRALRPKQWVKNVLVLAVPVAAGRLGDPEVLLGTVLAGVAFCLLSSAVYLVNDSVDVEADRRHPVKRLRPIAAGEISVGAARGVSAVLALAGLVLAALAGWQLLGVMIGYLVLQLGYSVWFKHEPVLDILLVTSGFVLRAVAGGAASDIYVSQWFLLVAGFGSLFIVSGKRYSELHTLGAESGTRQSLVRYSATYLRFVWGVAAGATLLAFSLWAFENPSGGTLPWATISIAPFVAGVLRYAVDIDAGTAAEPEDIIWADRVLQGIGVAWLVIVLLGVLDV
ncbi:phosphoribose diphosphate--decaprenyl-phosphate phosphoribosyltransferase [Nocardioides sp. Root122]|uniref:decaprenyl-phosphate phosphoribosyltransferase n=1 Tax=Nocardioides TaxID=1839 RepID=UPI000703945A|nr:MULTISPECIES: decaprenyl-phosphate phosphoribosyltransferase [Nocardioides]KQV69777.1 phosphoribose diphosphate--decaprenyl-phosphate phosphoribosyltransferase [Nocardioides sp. Root122]MCK9823017.1 decaprenyl-phosphate phosphoribosyltransferase [Nocardioides cavernae]